MGRSHGHSIASEKPIYESMYDSGIVDKKMFNLCLGKNGGYFQIGGYSEDRHLEDVQWYKFTKNSGSNYKIALYGVKVGDHFVENSQQWSIGFVDSGTTFSYIPIKMFDALNKEMDRYCQNAKA